jgi:hypothetical protein
MAGELGAFDGADIALSRCAFAADAATTFSSLAGTSTGP